MMSDFFNLPLLFHPFFPVFLFFPEHWLWNVLRFVACSAHNGRSNSTDSLAKPHVCLWLWHLYTHCRQLGGLVCSEQKAGSDRGSPLCCCALASGAFHLDIVEFWWGLQPLQDRKPVRLRESDCGKWGVPVLASLGSSGIFELGCAQRSSLAYRLVMKHFSELMEISRGLSNSAQFAPFCFLSWWKAEEAAETWICVRCLLRKHLCPRPGALYLPFAAQLCCAHILFPPRLCSPLTFRFLLFPSCSSLLPSPSFSAPSPFSLTLSFFIYSTFSSLLSFLGHFFAQCCSFPLWTPKLVWRVPLQAP